MSTTARTIILTIDVTDAGPDPGRPGSLRPRRDAGRHPRPRWRQPGADPGLRRQRRRGAAERAPVPGGLVRVRGPSGRLPPGDRHAGPGLTDSIPVPSRTGALAAPVPFPVSGTPPQKNAPAEGRLAGALSFELERRIAPPDRTLPCRKISEPGRFFASGALPWPTVTQDVTPSGLAALAGAGLRYLRH